MIKKEIIQGFDISDKSAAIIGCGGLGCNIAVHLVGSGIGSLHLFDFDKVSQSNLNRQFLYTEYDTDKEKVYCAEKRLKEFCSKTNIVPHNTKITGADDLNLISDCDIIFMAVDNNTARKIISDFCILHRIPLVNGGIDGFFGTAYLFIPEKTACTECAGILTNASGDLKSVSMTAGIIGALEANLGVKYLLGDDEVGGILHIYDNGSITKLKIKSNHDCKNCGQKYEVKTNG